MCKIYINRKNIKYILEKFLPVQARYNNRSHRLSSNIDLVQNSFNLSNPPASRNCCLPTSGKREINSLEKYVKTKIFSGLQKQSCKKELCQQCKKKVDCKISQKVGRTIFKVLMQIIWHDFFCHHYLTF